MRELEHSFRFVGFDRDVYEVRSTRTAGRLNGERVAPHVACRAFLDAAPGLRTDPRFVAWCEAEGLLVRRDEASEHVARELWRGETGAYVMRRIDVPCPPVDPPDPSDPPDDPPPHDPQPPVDPPPTWFEVTYVDELGEPLSDVPVRVTAGGVWQSATDGSGTVRVDDAEISFASARVTSHSALHEQLRERWTQARGQPWIAAQDDAATTIVRDVDPVPTVALESKTPHTVVIQPSLSRVRIVGAAFDTNKTFLLPAALSRIQRAVDLYGEHPGASLLVVGHTDTSGEPGVNDPLSLRRAQAVAAYLHDDVDAWLVWYEPSVPSSARWGELEDRMMLDAILQRHGEQPEGDRVEHFQQTRGLQVDGDIGQQTRRQLVAEYMALDGTTVPADITVVAHGCGENFPLDDDGVELQVDPPDGEDDPTDRRVELLFFDPPFGILPPPPGSNSPPGGPEYLEWLLRSRQTDDFIVGNDLALAVRVTDAHTSEILVGASVALVRGGGGSDSGGIATDAYGVSAFMDLGAGTYSVQVSHAGYEPFAGAHVLRARDPPTIIPVPLRAAGTVPTTFVTIRVVHEHDGSAIEGRSVRVRHAEGFDGVRRTGADGMATFVELPPQGTVDASVLSGEPPDPGQATDADDELDALDAPPADDDTPPPPEPEVVEEHVEVAADEDVEPPGPDPEPDENDDAPDLEEVDDDHLDGGDDEE